MSNSTANDDDLNFLEEMIQEDRDRQANEQANEQPEKPLPPARHDEDDNWMSRR
jgi:hypothetical protein